MSDIRDLLNKIKYATYGKEVRQSIHDGLNKINQETESTSKKQEKLERTFDDLIINAGNSNAEVVAARNGFETLGKRLNNFDSQLEQIKTKNEILKEKKENILREKLGILSQVEIMKQSELLINTAELINLKQSESDYIHSINNLIDIIDELLEGGRK